MLQNASDYWAHTGQAAKPSETLEEHIELVMAYFEKLCQVHQIDEVLDSLIADMLAEIVKDTDREMLENFVKELFINAVVFHDYGKVNENFQHQRMKNPRFAKVNNGIESRHSALGAYLFCCKHLQQVKEMNLPDEECTLACFLVLLLAYPIFRHHNAILNMPVEEIGFKAEVAEKIQGYLQKYNLQVDDDLCVKFWEQVRGLFEEYLHWAPKNEFALFALLKLNFSLLTAADYLATAQYVNNWPLLTDFGVLDTEAKQQLLKNFKERQQYKPDKVNFNKILYQDLPYYRHLPLEELQAPSNQNLNLLRQKMAAEVVENMRANVQQNLFYMEAPTGGGKTNLSMLALAELLEADLAGKIAPIGKVFYVFPFTTLITQTFASLKEQFNLSQEQIAQIHARAGLNSKEQDSDGLYGNDKLNYIDNLFLHYPICLLSHIRFFDILKTNEKESNYLLHRLANSVVIMDELQAYSPEHWDKIIYFVVHYARHFNIRFILMSATLPKLSLLKHIPQKDADFVHLLANSKQDYFLNPNFKGRVNFNFDLLENKDFTLEQLAEVVFEKSRDYATQQGSVHTVIEFIFKKSASAFYQLVKDQDFFDEILILSGTILEPRRKEIINFLKNKDQRAKNILLITTQVVEAGVDIDMDLGFKNQSLIDSDEQLAGRVNRNVNKQQCQVFLFKIDEPHIIYGKDARYKTIRQKFKPNDYQEILNTKNFDRLYELVLEGINEWNKTEGAIGFGEYTQAIRRLYFQDVHHKFKLIDQDNFSVFVPLALPVTIPGVSTATEEAVFSSEELNYLMDKGVYQAGDRHVDGAKVFDLYENILRQKSFDKLIDIKKMQAIMSRFVFSIHAYSQDLKKLRAAGFEEKYGFLLIGKECYDYYSGIDAGKLEDFNFL